MCAGLYDEEWDEEDEAEAMIDLEGVQSEGSEEFLDDEDDDDDNANGLQQHPPIALAEVQVQ